jgi:hypothetical protein
MYAECPSEEHCGGSFFGLKEIEQDHKLQQLHLKIVSKRLRRNGRPVPPKLRYVPRAGSASPERFLSLSIGGLTANVFYGEFDSEE